MILVQPPMPTRSSIDNLLTKRRTFSEKQLGVLERKLSVIHELEKYPDLSIYVTGSYGRLEANKRSDLDLFFITRKAQPSRIEKTLIDSEIINIARLMRFPDFSNDGQYLQIHDLREMLHQLGGPEDDYKNFFTARLLLLLESRPVYNPEAYERILKSTIQAYFRDYHDHVKDFRPIFLVNDILRFWKTLCLNYEKRRNVPAPSRTDKNKNHVKNFKLKFSRLSICFSTVIPIAAMPSASPTDIFRLTQLPPLERLRSAVGNEEASEQIFNKLIQEYSWFLEMSAREDIDVWMGNRSNRRQAFKRADHFGTLMYSLLTEMLKGTDNQRFLII